MMEIVPKERVQQLSYYHEEKSLFYPYPRRCRDYKNCAMDSVQSDTMAFASLLVVTAARGVDKITIPIPI